MIITVEDSAYTRYLDEKVSVSAADTAYSYDITFTGEMSADIKFQLGNIGNAAAVGAHDVTISDISWTKKQ